MLPSVALQEVGFTAVPTVKVGTEGLFKVLIVASVPVQPAAFVTVAVYVPEVVIVFAAAEMLLFQL